MSSWAAVVARGQVEGLEPMEERISEEECAAAKDLVIGDRLIISEEVGSDCFSRWKFGLVGRFVRGTQPLAVIKAALQFYWGRSRSFEILQANDKAWLILFESENDLLWALHNGPWAICGSVLFLERWTIGFDFSSPVLTSVPVWVLFPDLPGCLMTRNVVIALASRVGTPILLDTASLAVGNARVPRVKVICDLADPVVEGSFIEVNGFSVWQRYKYGGFVRPCHNCGIIGHSHSVCPQGVFVSQRGRSKSRRKRVVSESRDAFAKHSSLHGASSEVVTEAGAEVRDSHKLIILLSGSEEAEITVEEEAGLNSLAGREEAPTDHSVGTREEQKEEGLSRLQGLGSTIGVSLDRSDSEEEPPAFKGPALGTGRGAGAVGKSKEDSLIHSSTRGSRRGRDQSVESSIADRFRAAGASEGGRVKTNKSHKATKVAFEA